MAETTPELPTIFLAPSGCVSKEFYAAC